jgi:hypothetical protein
VESSLLKRGSLIVNGGFCFATRRSRLEVLAGAWLTRSCRGREASRRADFKVDPSHFAICNKGIILVGGIFLAQQSAASGPRVNGCLGKSIDPVGLTPAFRLLSHPHFSDSRVKLNDFESLDSP